MPEVPSTLLGSVLALASAVFYAAMYFLVRAGVRKTDLDGGGFVTTVVNALLLGGTVVVLTVTGHGPAWDLRAVFWFAVAGTLGTFTGRVFMFAGLRRIGPVRTAAIVNTAPVLTISLSVLVLGEQLSPLGALAALLVLGGLSLLAADAFATADPTRSRDGLAPAASGTPTADRTAPSVWGLVMSGLSALSFGTARLSRRLGFGYMPDAIVGSMVGATTALAWNLALQVQQGRVRSVVIASLREPRPALWGAGLCSTLGLVCFFAALQFAPLAHVAVVSASETVITMLMSRVLFPQREHLSARVLIAACCVFGAGALISLG